MADKYVAIHQNPEGPGDKRPTAMQIINDEKLQDSWNDRVVFITGCSSGLGIETARALAVTGATLYLTARDLKKAKAALGDLADSKKVHLLLLDLNSLASVRSCAAEFLSQSKQLNTLILNAGVMKTPEGRTEDGFETQFGTNHLAHFLLFNLLKDVLIASSLPEYHSRVVILASVAHRFAEVNFDDPNFEKGYDAWDAYGASKTANLWTANEIERRFSAQNLHAWSLQPGGVVTGLMQHMSDDEQQGSKEDPELSKIFKNPPQGASTTVWAATAAALEGNGGKYLEDCQIAPVWEESFGQWGIGYSPSWAYDPEKEAKLWKISCDMVGLDSN